MQHPLIVLPCHAYTDGRLQDLHDHLDLWVDQCHPLWIFLHSAHYLDSTGIQSRDRTTHDCTPVGFLALICFRSPKSIQADDSYGGACIVTFITSVISDRIGKRSPIIICGLTVSLVGLIMLFALPKDKGPIARYIGCLLVLIGGYPAIPGTLAWNCKSIVYSLLTISEQLRDRRDPKHLCGFSTVFW